MRSLFTGILALSVALLAGCNGSIVKTHVVGGITQAEASVFTTDGRLFVTGGDSIFEVKKNSSGTFYTVQCSTPAAATITGIVQRGNYIYANMNRGNIAFGTAESFLIAAPLTPSAPVFSVVTKISNTCMANELTADAQGRLYLTNSTGVFSSIIRIIISADPMKAASQSVWLSLGGVFPNGIKMKNNTIYYTTLNSVKKVAITSNGSAGTIRTIYSRAGLTFLDDLLVTDDMIIVCDFMSGKLVALTQAGSYIGETDPLAFNGPSSVNEVKAPMFSGSGVIVLEKMGNSITLVTLQ